MSASDWPRDINGHTVTMEWECEECGASFSCLSQFRQQGCHS